MQLHPFPAPASGVATVHPGGGAVLATRFHTTVLFSGPGYGMSELGNQNMHVHRREPFPPRYLFSSPLKSKNWGCWPVGPGMIEAPSHQ
jgi:hypothetical protein